MGKIRIKSFDETSAEDEAKLKAKREAKKAQKEASKAHLSGMGGGQRVKTVGPSLEELEVIEKEKTEETATATVSDTKDSEDVMTESKSDTKVIASGNEAIFENKTTKKTKKEKFKKVKTIGKRHKSNQTIVSKTINYNIDQALEALKKFKKSKFDETVELHVNVKEKGTSGQVVLPHGTGKTLVIKIADDAIIEEVSRGKINFDILVATPQMMPQLAKVAKVLGPRGLMPNPKNGTVTDKPEEAVKKLSAGQISYKTEPVSPIIHVSVGKISFEDKKLKENISSMLGSIGAAKINSVTLKSTMSPGIRLDYSTLAR